MATNVTRFMNYRVVARHQFYNRGLESTRSNQTILVPEVNRENDDRFRNTLYSNFNRNRAVTARTARTSQMNEAEGDSEGEGEDNQEPRAVEVAMHTNGFSTYGVQAGASIAKYQMVGDNTYIGDSKLLNQESSNFKNTQSLIFFIIIVLLL